MNNLEHLKYPIGKFEYGKTYTISETKKSVKKIARLPKELKKLLKKATKSNLDASYREGGWTVRQVIHHLSDSHVNAYVRMKLAVTEHNPVIKPYDERAWAELETGKTASVKDSYRVLKAIHKKWIDFIESLSDEDLYKGYVHPAMNRTVLLPEAIALYAWHSEHHLAHIRLVVDAKAHAGNKKDKEIHFQKITLEAPVVIVTPPTPVVTDTATPKPEADKKVDAPKTPATATKAPAKRAPKAATATKTPPKRAPKAATATKTPTKRAPKAAKGSTAPAPVRNKSSEEVLESASLTRVAKQNASKPKTTLPDDVKQAIYDLKQEKARKIEEARLRLEDKSKAPVAKNKPAQKAAPEADTNTTPE